MASKYSNMTVKAFRRENGRVGVRNHVVILPVDDISNAACEAVANNVKGTMAIPHAYGRLQFGEDLELHFRTMIGTGANPNVAAVVVIGIEPGWTKRIADGIRATGKPVAEFSIEQNGDFETIRAASWAAKEFVHMTSEYQREECSISELWVSTKCGESDTTTGLGPAQLLATCMTNYCQKGSQGSLVKHLKSQVRNTFVKNAQSTKRLVSVGTKCGKRIKTTLFLRTKLMTYLTVSQPKVTSKAA